MEAVSLIVIGVYLFMVGIHGNGLALVNQLGQEKQFFYWIIAIVVIIALWESQEGEEVAKPFAALIVLGFLLSSSTVSGTKQANYISVGNGLKAVLPEL